LKRVNFGEIVNIRDSEREPLNTKERNKIKGNGTYPYIGANGIVDWVDEYIFDEKILCIAEDGGSWGKNEVCTKIYNEKCWVNNHAHVVTAKENVLTEYLSYYLNYQDLNSFITGTTRGKLNQTNLKKLEIPIPSLSKQKVIVAKLDRAQWLIDIDKEMLAKYDDLIQSVFLEMFGRSDGEKVPISELVKLNPRKSEISNIDKSMQATFLGMANIGENGSLNLSEIKTVEESWKGYTYFRENDVLFAKITPCMENGKGAIAKGLINGLGFGSTEFHVLRPIEGISRPAWIYHLTHSDKFRKIAKSFMTGSAGQKRVPKHFFNRFKVVKPSIDKQLKFEEIAKKISLDKKRLRKSIKKSEELFSSLVQGAFGKE